MKQVSVRSEGQSEEVGGGHSVLAVAADPGQIFGGCLGWDGSARRRTGVQGGGPVCRGWGDTAAAAALEMGWDVVGNKDERGIGRGCKGFSDSRYRADSAPATSEKNSQEPRKVKHTGCNFFQPFPLEYCVRLS